MIVRSAPAARAAPWLSTRLGGAPLAWDARFIEIVRGDELVGVAALDHWTHASARVLLSADGIAVRPLLAAVREWAFTQAGLAALRTEIPSHSKRAQRLAALFGFTEVHRMRDGYAPGDDLLLYECHKESWHEHGR